MRTKKFTYEGDSITAGSLKWNSFLSTSMNAAYPELIFVENNIALAGDQLSDMITDAPTDIEPKYSAYVDNFVIVLGGINDFNNNPSFTGTQVYERTKQLYQLIESYGQTPIFMEILPSGALGDTVTDKINEHNALLRSDPDLPNVILTRNNTKIGQNDSWNDSTYYADSIHLNTTGQQVLNDEIVYPYLVAFGAFEFNGAVNKMLDIEFNRDVLDTASNTRGIELNTEFKRTQNGNSIYFPANAKLSDYGSLLGVKTIVMFMNSYADTKILKDDGVDKLDVSSGNMSGSGLTNTYIFKTIEENKDSVTFNDFECVICEFNEGIEFLTDFEIETSGKLFLSRIVCYDEVINELTRISFEQQFINPKQLL